MKTFFSFAAIVAIVLLCLSTTAAAVSVAKLASALPTYSSTFEVHATKVDIPEGVTAASHIYQDAENGHILQNHTSPEGYYAMLVRNDKLKLYFIYDVNGAPFCLAYPLQTPLPTPTPSFVGVGTDLRRSVGPNGKTVGQFRFRINRYIMTAQYYIDSGLPAANYDKETFGIGTIINEFVNGSIKNPAVFDVPAACNSGVQTQTPQDHLPHSSEVHKWLRENLVAYASPSEHWRLAFGDVLRTPFTAANIPLRKSNAATNKASSSTRTSAHDVEMQRATSELLLRTSKTLPTAVDNRRYATPVRNQGWCGSCFCFSSVAATEVVHRKAMNAPKTYNTTSWLSVQSAIDCTQTPANSTALIPSKGCLGGWPGTVLGNIVDNGIVDEVDYPFTGVTGRTCQRSASMPSFSKPLKSHYLTQPLNTTQIMEAVATHGAAVAVITFTGAANGDVLYSGGVYNEPSCVPGLDHAVTIVGYGHDTEAGLDYWLVKNSVGQAWGEGGYFRMARGVNMCGIEDYGFVPVAATD